MRDVMDAISFSCMIASIMALTASIVLAIPAAKDHSWTGAAIAGWVSLGLAVLALLLANLDIKVTRRR